jgi:hypothetical protein
MRGMLLSAILMIIAAGMMGCGDSIVPCATDEECAIDMPGPGDVPMVCNLEVSPQEKCDDMYGWMEGLPFPLPIPDCDSMSTTPGVCEVSFEFPF